MLLISLHRNVNKEQVDLVVQRPFVFNNPLMVRVIVISQSLTVMPIYLACTGPQDQWNHSYKRPKLQVIVICAGAFNHKLTFGGFLGSLSLRKLSYWRNKKDLDNKKTYSMDHCRSEICQSAKHFKMTDWRIKSQETQLFLHVAQFRSVIVFL